jgi:hypothetical protein
VDLAACGLSAADARTPDGQLSTSEPPYLALFAALLVNILKKARARAGNLNGN